MPQRFAYNPRAADVPAEINDVDMVSGDDGATEEQVGTAISSMDLQESQEPDTQGTDECDIMFESPSLPVLNRK